MLSDRLRNETREAHVSVEALIIPKIKKLDSANAYADLLRIFYGFFKPVEEKIAAIITNQELPDVDKRRKAETIIEDIDFIGEQKPDTECNDLPAITSRTMALGAMYVLEGSTLGGQHLTKMISGKMNFTGTEGVTFFSGYGSNTMSMWSNFRIYMDKFTGSATAENEVIESANETFMKFKNWIERN